MKTSSMALMLTRARFNARRGEALLDIFALIAYTTSATLLLTTLGGFWMFFGRREDSSLIAQNLGIPAEYLYASFATNYVVLALIALGVLAIPLLNVGAGAARLSANARMSRLASLRLVGVSARQVTMLSVFEAGIVASIGYVVGIVIYLLTLPLWSNVKFQATTIDDGEMLLPVWVILAAYLLFLLIILVATLLGLLRVSISPLGVAKKETPKALSAWRLVALVGAIALMWVTTSDYSPLGSSVQEAVTVAGVFVLFFLSLSIVGPWLIQLIFRPFVRTSSPAGLIAMRRITGNPKNAWTIVSSVALMSLVATVVTTSLTFTVQPTGRATAEALAFESIDGMLMTDITTGVLIALAFALVLAAVSVLIQQISDVYSRQNEAQMLAHIGTPERTVHLARILQVMLPVIASIVLAVLLGLMPTLATGNSPRPENIALLGTLLTIGVAITLVASLSTIPVQRRLLSKNVRKND